MRRAVTQLTHPHKNLFFYPLLKESSEIALDKFKSLLCDMLFMTPNIEANEDDSTPADPRLLEFSVSKTILLNALFPHSLLGTTAAIGILEYPNNRGFGGIFFNRGTEQEVCNYPTALYASNPIMDDEMGHKTIFVTDWPFFLVSCAQNFIEAIKALDPDENDRFEVRLSYFCESASVDQAESHFMIFGKAGASVGSRIRHPVSPEESVFLRVNNPRELYYYHN
ncbi:MAG: hypothetical protein HPY61_01620 [Methanotrichaceae archaeon]|nr:hypothetical protein [Methanotrichaceae archaeon]